MGRWCCRRGRELDDIDDGFVKEGEDPSVQRVVPNYTTKIRPDQFRTEGMVTTGRALIEHQASLASWLQRIPGSAEGVHHGWPAVVFAVSMVLLAVTVFHLSIDSPTDGDVMQTSRCVATTETLYWDAVKRLTILHDTPAIISLVKEMCTNDETSACAYCASPASKEVQVAIELVDQLSQQIERQLWGPYRDTLRQFQNLLVVPAPAPAPMSAPSLLSALFTPPPAPPAPEWRLWFASVPLELDCVAFTKMNIAFNSIVNCTNYLTRFNPHSSSAFYLKATTYAFVKEFEEALFNTRQALEHLLTQATNRAQEPSEATVTLIDVFDQIRNRRFGTNADVRTSVLTAFAASPANSMISLSDWLGWPTRDDRLVDVLRQLILQLELRLKEQDASWSVSDERRRAYYSDVLTCSIDSLLNSKPTAVGSSTVTRKFSEIELATTGGNHG